MSCSSVSATPCALPTSCRTSTNTRSPVRPALCVTDHARGALAPCRRPAAARGTAAGRRPTCGAAAAPAAGSRRARMAVGADLALPRAGQEVEPVPQRRQLGAGGRRRVVAVQRGRQVAHRRGGDLVVQRLAAAFPAAQLRQQFGGEVGVGSMGAIRPAPGRARRLAYDARMAALAGTSDGTSWRRQPCSPCSPRACG